MFTSRAEYRLMLREDNADLRLTPRGQELGLVDETRWRRFCEKRDNIDREQERLAQSWVRLGSEQAARLERALGQPLSRDSKVSELLKRPELDYKTLMTLPGVGPGVADLESAQQVEIQAKYHGYLARQHAEVVRAKRYEDRLLPLNFDYTQVSGLSAEAVQRLEEVRPATLGQASRISGITPSAVSLLLVHIKKYPRTDATRRRA